MEIRFSFSVKRYLKRQALVPAQIPADQLQDFKGFLDVVLDTVVGGAAPDVLTLGHQL